MTAEDERFETQRRLTQLDYRFDGDDGREHGDIRVLYERLKQMQKDIDANQRRIEALVAERDSLFRWGVLSLGAVVVSIGAWAVSVVMGSHVK